MLALLCRTRIDQHALALVVVFFGDFCDKMLFRAIAPFIYSDCVQR